jgi:hypothetical protein
VNIELVMKDGTVKKFLHEGRPGGSYTKNIDFVPGFVVVSDEWDKKTYIPADEVKEIKTTPNRW